MSSLWDKVAGAIVSGMTPAQLREALLFIAVILLWVIVSWLMGWWGEHEGMATRQHVEQQVSRLEAHINEVETVVTTSIRDFHVESLERELFDLHIVRCALSTDSAMRQETLKRILDRQRRYHDLRGHHYPLPPCDTR